MTGKVVDFTPSRKRARGYIADYKPQAKTLDLLAKVKAVLDEYREHWPLTVRQVFYRLVGAHGYDKTEAGYKTLCHHVVNARRGGVISFAAIRDDGVTTVRMDHYEDADAFLMDYRRRAKNFQRDKLSAQPFHAEVWCEAAGMIHQLADVAHEFSIRVYSSSGFDSLTAKKDIADRICRIGKPAIILHLGDFDPSGEGIFKAVAEDVGAFVETDRPHGHVNVEFRRVALTEDQVNMYDLPTAPAKASDSRSKGWAGETCQLEALSPAEIASILKSAIYNIVDIDAFVDAQIAEEDDRESLTRLLLTGPSAA